MSLDNDELVMVLLIIEKAAAVAAEHGAVYGEAPNTEYALPNRAEVEEVISELDFAMQEVARLGKKLQEITRTGDCTEAQSLARIAYLRGFNRGLKKRAAEYVIDRNGDV